MKTVPSIPAWNNVVLEYEKRVEPLTSSFVQELIAPFQDSCNKNDHNKAKLLDVGCGSGLGASMAFDAGLDVTATDVSSSMVDRVKTRFPHITATCVDGQTLPFDKEFDYAMGVFSVIFFPSPKAGLEQIHTALVDGGEVAIAAWGNVDETPGFQIFSAAVQSLTLPETIQASSKPKRIVGSTETLTTLLQDSGFEKVRVQGPVQRHLTVESAEEYYNRFALTSPNIIQLLEKLDDTQQQDLKAKVMSLALERSTSDEHISIPVCCYFGYGMKPIVA